MVARHADWFVYRLPVVFGCAGLEKANPYRYAGYLACKTSAQTTLAAFLAMSLAFSLLCKIKIRITEGEWVWKGNQRVCLER